ncbi:putative heme/steroid binding protein [Nocardia transvalensis]|uniref:Putative heme/steroid binding protein n=1 Tax=Nocardia transvalensis TaxID=37333 RepID=A0A7W9PE80_9NOCA|nr:hypothetical protein [Nocardia transvalensis]MBB5914420.1 putative heme/steroid binding protein [Nocardia transvalensis]
MNEEQIRVVGAIEATFEQAIRQGLRRSAVAGASDEQIDRFAAAQGCADAPVSVRAVLRVVGSQPGLWLAGTHFGVHAVTSDTKRQAIASLTTVQHGMRAPDGLLTLTSHQSYAYTAIDGADLHLDDPPVWAIIEHEYARETWPHVSTWFTATAPDIARYRERAEIMAEMGRTPRWADAINLG